MTEGARPGGAGIPPGAWQSLGRAGVRGMRRSGARRCRAAFAASGAPRSIDQVAELAAAYPGTADAVFRKVLRKPGFTWAEHGEALMRRRKPWYYDAEPRPGVSVIGSRLQELTAHG